MGIFVAKEWHRIVRLPLSVPELMMVDSQFYVKPVLPVFMHGGNFYLLALSQNKIRFFEGSRDELHEVELEGIPHSMEEAAQTSSAEQSLQFHTGAPSTGDHRAAIFHGQGGGNNESKTPITHFFNRSKRALPDI